MSQSFTKKDSARRVYRATRRHQRLARRTENAQAIEIAARIDAPRQALGTALTEHEAPVDATQDAFDDWEQADRALDRVVKSTDRKCVDWDEDHPTARTKQTVFGGSTTSQITNSARETEPDLVVKMVRRGAGLPESHPAKPLLPVLTEQANTSRTGYRAWVDAAQREAVAATAVEVARLQVARVYYDNQIDI
jgi:hypothetical protein